MMTLQSVEWSVVIALLQIKKPEPMKERAARAHGLAKLSIVLCCDQIS